MQSDMPDSREDTLTRFLKAIVKSNVPGNPVFLLCRPGLSSKLPLRGDNYFHYTSLALQAGEGRFLRNATSPTSGFTHSLPPRQSKVSRFLNLVSGITRIEVAAVKKTQLFWTGHNFLVAASLDIPHDSK